MRVGHVALLFVTGLLSVRCGSAPTAPASVPAPPAAAPAAPAPRAMLNQAVVPGAVRAAAVTGHWTVGTTSGDFRLNPYPADGTAPFDVSVNMCHSNAPETGAGLRFSVEWGDGKSEDGGNCRFEHAYAEGTYTLTACVSDSSSDTSACTTQSVSVRPGKGCVFLPIEGLYLDFGTGHALTPGASAYFDDACSEAVSGLFLAVNAVWAPQGQAQADHLCNAVFGQSVAFSEGDVFACF